MDSTGAGSSTSSSSAPGCQVATTVQHMVPVPSHQQEQQQQQQLHSHQQQQDHSARPTAESLDLGLALEALPALARLFAVQPSLVAELALQLRRLNAGAGIDGRELMDLLDDRLPSCPELLESASTSSDTLCYEEQPAAVEPDHALPQQLAAFRQEVAALHAQQQAQLASLKADAGMAAAAGKHPQPPDVPPLFNAVADPWPAGAQGHADTEGGIHQGVLTVMQRLAEIARSNALQQLPQGVSYAYVTMPGNSLVPKLLENMAASRAGSSQDTGSGADDAAAEEMQRHLLQHALAVSSTLAAAIINEAAAQPSAATVPPAAAGAPVPTPAPAPAMASGTSAGQHLSLHNMVLERLVQPHIGHQSLALYIAVKQRQTLMALGGKGPPKDLHLLWRDGDTTARSVMAQVFAYMRALNLRRAVLTCYETFWIIQRDSTTSNTLRLSQPISHKDRWAVGCPKPTVMLALAWLQREAVRDAEGAAAAAAANAQTEQLACSAGGSSSSDNGTGSSSSTGGRAHAGSRKRHYGGGAHASNGERHTALSKRPRSGLGIPPMLNSQEDDTTAAEQLPAAAGEAASSGDARVSVDVPPALPDLKPHDVGVHSPTMCVGESTYGFVVHGLWRGRPAAIKVMDGHRAARCRAWREFCMYAALRELWGVVVPEAFLVGTLGGRVLSFLATALLRARPLSQVPIIAAVAAAATAVLRAVHAKGILHGDVSLSNMLLLDEVADAAAPQDVHAGSCTEAAAMATADSSRAPGAGEVQQQEPCRVFVIDFGFARHNACPEAFAAEMQELQSVLTAGSDD